MQARLVEGKLAPQIALRRQQRWSSGRAAVPAVDADQKARVKQA
jgi:hypothetical protein